MAIANYICFEKSEGVVCIDNHGQCTAYKTEKEADEKRLFLDRDAEQYISADEMVSYCQMKTIKESLDYVRDYARVHKWELFELSE